VIGQWIVLVFAMLLPTIATWTYFVGLASGGQSSVWVPVVYSGSKVVVVLLPVVWLGWTGKERLRPSIPSFGGLANGLGFGLLAAAVLLGLYYGVLRGTSLMHTTAEKLREKVAEFHADTEAQFIMLGAFISIAHSLLEEYYWRWFVFGQLKTLLPLGVALLVSSLAFMSHHVVVLGVYFPGKFFTAALPFSLCVAVGGAFWGWLYHRTGSIWSAWLSHLIIDSAIMVVGYDLLFG